MNVSTSTLPYSHTRPRSLRPRSTSITCSARSFSSSSSSCGDPPVLLGTSPRAGACRRSACVLTRRRPADRQQRLGARAGDLEVAEVQEVHVRARVDRAQAAVDRERLDRHRRRPALGGHDLEGVAGVDVLDDPLPPSLRTARADMFDWNSGIARGRGRRARRAARDRPSAPRTSPIVRAARRVGALDVGLGVRSALARIVTVCLRWSKTTSASDSISAMSGSPSGSGSGLAQRLDGAHEVIAEEADRAAGERRRVAGIGAWLKRATCSAASAYGSPPSASDQRSTARGRKPMNDQRPTRWPCSADSSRNAGSPGASARSFRNADTGVSQSAMKLCRSGIRLCAAAERRACSRPARPRSLPRRRSATAAIEHPLGVGERRVPGCAAARAGGRAGRRPLRRRARRTPRARRA